VQVAAARPQRVVAVRAAAPVVVASEKFNLNNIAPAEGSRRDKRRIARGYGGKGGGTGGRGTRGQKSRSGGGVRPGFEGGQMPLYRRLPKLKGIAGGMGAGLPDYLVVNVSALDAKFDANAEVDLAALEEHGVVNPSGRDAKLPLKVLGHGAITKPLTVRAAAFSASAKAAIEAAGGKAEVVAPKPKWTRAAHEAALEAAGKN
jgi:large subunit ribosomal protein L15